MHCDQCGAELDEDARFCGSCGTPVPGASEPGPRRSWRERCASLIGRTRGERLLAAGTAAALVVAVVAFFALDVGGEESEAFIRAADAQCVDAKQEIAIAGQETVGESGSRAQVRFTGALVSAVTTWMLAFEELDVPGDEAETPEELSAALLNLSVEASRLNRAVRSGDSAAITELAEAVDDGSVRVESAVDELGLERCGQISLAGR